MKYAAGKNLVVFEKIGNGIEAGMLPLHQTDSFHRHRWQSRKSVYLDDLSHSPFRDLLLNLRHTGLYLPLPGKPSAGFRRGPPTECNITQDTRTTALSRCINNFESVSGEKKNTPSLLRHHRTNAVSKNYPYWNLVEILEEYVCSAEKSREKHSVCQQNASRETTRKFLFTYKIRKLERRSIQEPHISRGIRDKSFACQKRHWKALP